MKSQTIKVREMEEIIRALTLELMNYGGTTPQVTCEVVAEEHPQLCFELGADRVLSLCEEIQESSDAAESARLQELFETFNKKYFDGQLNFAILAVYDAGGSPEPISAWVDFINRRIYMLLMPRKDLYPSILLHHMAHAVTMTLDDTDEPWIKEMRRLREMDAPVEAELEWWLQPRSESIETARDWPPLQPGTLPPDDLL